MRRVSGVNYNYGLTTIKTTASFRPPRGGGRAEKISARGSFQMHYLPLVLSSRHLLPGIHAFILNDRAFHKPLE